MRPRHVAIIGLLIPLAGAALAAALVVRSMRGPAGAGSGASGVPALIFAEYGPTADRVYSAPADDLARRTLVATIEHAEGWSITPASAMAGSLVAYTVLGPGAAARRDAPAELWLLDVATGTQRRLARDADLLVPPAFDQRGERVAYRSTNGDGEQRLVRVDLQRGAQRVLHRDADDFGVYPLGFDADGALLFAALSTAGTDVFRLRDGEQPQALLHASDELARDWRISPDGRSLSYLAPQLELERVVYRLHVVGIAGGDAQRLASLPGQQLAPVWTPSGDAITVGRDAYPAASAAAVTLSLAGGAPRALPAPERGFDAPLGWSPDGRYLAARGFDGASAYAPGREWLIVIADGARRTLEGRSELIFIGWLASG
ncbi:MAG: hypothetical protein EXR65_02965 [Dehalococcoidia bacterium]|nr:hypothetical protein [Dehalococcoidia bacterium]